MSARTRRIVAAVAAAVVVVCALLLAHPIARRGASVPLEVVGLVLGAVGLCLYLARGPR